MYPKLDEKKIHGHSISRGMNNPPLSKQLLEGVNLLGDEPTQKRLIDDFGEIAINMLYHDTKENFDVMPVRIYGNRIEISDGRSCTVEYAKQNWVLAV